MALSLHLKRDAPPSISAGRLIGWLDSPPLRSVPRIPRRFQSAPSAPSKSPRHILPARCESLSSFPAPSASPRSTAVTPGRRTRTQRFPPPCAEHLRHSHPRPTLFQRPFLCLFGCRAPARAKLRLNQSRIARQL